MLDSARFSFIQIGGHGGPCAGPDESPCQCGWMVYDGDEFIIELCIWEDPYAFIAALSAEHESDHLEHCPECDGLVDCLCWD